MKPQVQTPVLSERERGRRKKGKEERKIDQPVRVPEFSLLG
jgi:hypothetical protein